MSDLIMPLLIVCSSCGHIGGGDTFKVRKLDGQFTGEIRCPKCFEVFELGCNQIVSEDRATLPPNCE